MHNVQLSGTRIVSGGHGLTAGEAARSLRLKSGWQPRSGTIPNCADTEFERAQPLTADQITAVRLLMASHGAEKLALSKVSSRTRRWTASLEN